MKKEPTTEFGRELYRRLLPQLYRERDEGDLLALLDGYGHLLDRVHATIRQRLADSFPEQPPDDDARASQAWLLPYFADLVGARLVSPEVSGRRAEVGNAVAWRKGKGTLRVVEEIAQEVGSREVEVQEGWRRVLLTPRLDVPRRPGGTVDLRLTSRAVEAEPGSRGARRTRFPGAAEPPPAGPETGDERARRRGYRWWAQRHPDGAPCFPDSFEDVSARTVDVRSPAPGRGRIHPRRILLYAPPPSGFFPPSARPVTWQELLDDPELSEVERDRDGAAISIRVRDGVRVRVTDAPDLRAPADGVVTIRGAAFDEGLDRPSGRLALVDVAAPEVRVAADAGAEPALDVRSCLLGRLRCPDGLARLEYVTVLGEARARRLQASDCIFAGDLAVADPGEASCVRYSRVPDDLAEAPWLSAGNTRAVPLFARLDFFESGAWVRRRPAYGEAGCGVLDVRWGDPVCSGAEDGGEMGAYHDRYHCLLAEAVVEKLAGFLPMGVEPVLIPDPRLRWAPPELDDTEG